MIETLQIIGATILGVIMIGFALALLIVTIRHEKKIND